MGSILTHRPYLYLARNSTHYQVVIAVAIANNESLSITQNGREFTCFITTGEGNPGPNPQVIRQDFTISIPDPDWTGDEFLEIIVKLNGTTLDIDYGTLRMTAADTEGEYETGGVAPLLLVEIEDADSESPVFVPRLLVHPQNDLAIVRQDIEQEENGGIVYSIEIEENINSSISPDDIDLNQTEGVEDPESIEGTEVGLTANDKRRRVKIEYMNATPSL